MTITPHRIPSRALTEMLVSLAPFIPEGTWGSYQDAAVALGLGKEYAQPLSNAYLPLTQPLLRSSDGKYRRHPEVTELVAEQEIVAALEVGLPGAEDWQQDRRWDVAEIGAAYQRCEYHTLHAYQACGCFDH